MKGPMLTTVAAALIAASHLTAAVARADWLPEFSGYTSMASAYDGVVNFAVWQTTDSDWTDDFGAVFQKQIKGLVGLDNDTGFVFFYQVMNAWKPSTDMEMQGEDFDSFSISSAGGLPVSSVGYVQDRGFQDADGNLIGTSGDNNVLGPEPSSMSDDPLDATPTASNRTPKQTFNTATEQIEPSSATKGPTQVTFNFSTEIRSGEYSSLLWVTSDISDKKYIQYGAGKVGVAGQTLDGDVPIPTPEPNSLILALLGGVVVVFLWRRAGQNLVGDSG